ncbi:hypothetical protein EDD66_10941 [Mobilisporobacter senegalensis]|uniref:Uncharacterized protein n=1 Tax=Mobilisporobacter senegalensis TaxID=1329262 RepID=A0A3N1XI64_9FIRM|nr:hypothetical protein [Mobilisporobacter senegalensis]ROR25831.1 hypothetical protein EDD66_10941 [Mobilisporobacter senegalensis]
MGHITSKDAYKNLEERINWFTQGTPPSDSLYKLAERNPFARLNSWFEHQCKIRVFVHRMHN